MDDDGYVQVPQGPGLGIEFNWDYINDNLIEK
jgi:L-alanine-DL-glutamate epimerase-like enolase superfamily enzyme